MLNFWVKQLSCVINRTACRSNLAGADSFVDSVNASSGDALTSAQRDEQLVANSIAACSMQHVHVHNKFLEDMELSMINHDHEHMQL